MKTEAQGIIKGRLMDTAAKAPLGLATVTVFKASDTTLITYRLSNPEGEFKVSGIPLNLSCRVVISFSGYNAYRKEFTLMNDSTLDMGTINMTLNSSALDEILVVAERPPVSVRRDTIEFNASSFKTLPTALVEDLLKKLPGVEVDQAGNIMANGKRVNRIMVDGKAFFGDDPKMATRNLPANVIDKIQVTEDKDEANRNSDGDLTNVGQVINLTLKKGIKKGWFGKLYGGAGTKDRYELGGIANIYRDTLQLSLLAFSNNINRSGFSFKEVQDLGGFSRSGFNSLMVMSRSGQQGFAVNGISFGGLDAGISRTTGAGFNLNHAPNKKKSFFLQYFYGNNHNTVDQLNNAQQFFHDTIVNTLTTTNTLRLVDNHTVSTGANLKPDSLTDISFRASYSYAHTNENVQALINVMNNKTGRISDGDGDQFNTTSRHNYDHNFFLTKRFRAKKGRTLNVYQFLTYSKNLQNYITESDYNYYYPLLQTTSFDQLRRQDIPTLSGQLHVNFAEPLSKKFTLRFNNRYEYVKDNQEIGIFDKDVLSSKYEQMNMGQSSGFERIQNRFTSNLSLSYKIKKITITAGASGLWQTIHNSFQRISNPINLNLFNILPGVSFQWKQLSANYSQNVTAPAIGYLIPVPDSTNPFYIRYGNPYLRPAKRRSLNINNYNFFQGSGASYNIYFNGSITDDDVVMSRTVAANGVQTVVPVNADGSINFYAGIGFGKEFKNKQKFIFNFRVSPNFNFDRRKLIVNNNVSTATTIGYGPSISMGLNWNDIVEFRPLYNPGISRTTYTDPFFRNIKTVTHSLEGELIVRLPKKLIWETNVAYRYSNQVAPGLPKENILWNAAVTLMMLKGDAGLLKLSVFDILDRNNGLYRYTTGNQIVDQQTNVLQRFAELSFTYNIRNMGAPKKVGGRDRMFLF
ncbi:MAG TPA: outer membrane beta-barrel protein [Flavisolibacter sp.]|nr:outer membrane beta-barrel protein [Flavisolibacter sp.]